MRTTGFRGFLKQIIRPDKKNGPTTDADPAIPVNSTNSFEAKYVLGEKLGKGAFGIVFVCTSKTSTTSFAVKVIEKTLSNGIKS